LLKFKKTIIYIDGYNLYYGRLKSENNSFNFKWLDVFKLFQNILKAQDPNSEIIKVKYFTAPALGKFATHGHKSTEAQQTYHRALKELYPDLIEIIMGGHTSAPKSLPTFNPDSPKSFDKTQRSPVWVLEEKKTDVQIALEMYHDAIKDKCSQVILCSNDSDIEPALKKIREEKPDFKIGVVAPISPPQKGKKSGRASASLLNKATWARHYIRDDELQKALLNEKILTRKKPILKPEHWKK